MTERCERTELLVDDCAHCRGNDKTIEEQVAAERPNRTTTATGWFPANYPGQCAGCGDHVNEGDQICRVLGIDGWVAECCARDVTS